MEDKSLYKHIRLVYNSNTSSFKGHIELKAGSTIRIDKINIRVIFEVRGTLRPSKFILETIELEQGFLLEEGLLTKIPFEFNCSSYEYESYIGTHFEFSYKVETILFINEADKDKVNRSTWNKLKSITDLHTKIEWERAFKYKKKKTGYQVKEGEYRLESQIFNYILVVIMALIIFCILSFNLTFIKTIPIIIVVLFIIYNSYNVLKTYIKDPFLIQLTKNENGFYCKLKDNATLKFKTKQLYYQVEERVTDDRGTNESIHSQTIVTSKYRSLDPKLKEDQVEFSFPKRKDIRRFYHPYIEFKWIIKLELTYLKIPIIFYKEFEVENIELND